MASISHAESSTSYVFCRYIIYRPPLKKILAERAKKRKRNKLKRKVLVTQVVLDEKQLAEKVAAKLGELGQVSINLIC
jgi:hypothetical protein